MSEGKPWSGSGSLFVDVVQPVQHGRRADWASSRSRPQFGCLKIERAMRSLLVVVRHKFAQDRR
jgi:hypothetical protein